MINKLVTIKQAVIAAGGRGERLRPLTDDRPKPMALVNGRPFLEYLVELLIENGIEEIVMLLGYKAEKITQHFGDGKRFGVRIKYSIGTVEDETGTRLKNAFSMIDDYFLFLYSDNYWPMNLLEMVKQYNNQGKLVLQTVYNNKDGGGEYGYDNNVRVEEDGSISHYGIRSSDPSLNAIDTGFFIISKEVLAFLPPENVSFQIGVLPKLVEQKQLAAFRTDHPYYFITSPTHIPVIEEFFNFKKAFFLDRDGVINKQMPPHDYVKNWNEFEFLPGSKTALKKLWDKGYQLFVITNQRGIARGLMSESDLNDIHSNMSRELEEYGVKLTGIYYCPHDYNDHCDCRKPKPGLFFRAAREHKLNLNKCVFIGDSVSDFEAGEAAVIRTILVTPEKELLCVVNELIESK